jgi:hypothetical protein
MANIQKGEIPLSISGKSYTLFLGTNALDLLEEHFSLKAGKEVGWQEIFARVLKGDSLRYLRAFIWAAMQKYHPGTTLAQAGDLIDEGGGITGFAALVSEAAGVSLPTESDLKALGVNPARPRTAQRVRKGTRAKSIGTVSSATLDASV